MVFATATMMPIYFDYIVEHKPECIQIDPFTQYQFAVLLASPDNELYMQWSKRFVPAIRVSFCISLHKYVCVGVHSVYRSAHDEHCHIVHDAKEDGRGETEVNVDGRQLVYPLLLSFKCGIFAETFSGVRYRRNMRATSMTVLILIAVYLICNSFNLGLKVFESSVIGQEFVRIIIILFENTPRPRPVHGQCRQCLAASLLD